MVIKAISEAAAILETIHKINKEVNDLFYRGIVVKVENRTTDTLTLDFDRSTHTSGGFSKDLPDLSVAPGKASIFGSRGTLGLGFPTEGKAFYRGTQLNFTYEVNWQVPTIGDNTTNAYIDGGAHRYLSDNSAVSAFGDASAEHALSLGPMQRSWRRCIRCGTLNNTSSGLDAPCVTPPGGNEVFHDNDMSKEYSVLLGGLGGLDWVAKQCSRCTCLVAGPPALPAACAAGEQHDVSGGDWCAVVADQDAPGDPGWRACVLCGGIVIDADAACPTGGKHFVSPAPMFTVWRN
ncbi:hypothetical protein [Mycolicibacterium fortuitum]|uniref:hypothetical protein n=1 Tax=Mycolicibacterium fortuitum TaxID=1766 RepID=UPI0026045031|nr:hypothetical protein [Mycolicibacterium fortuitum]